jgi:hypothetical protein
MEFYILDTFKVANRRSLLSSKIKVGTTQLDASQDLELLGKLRVGFFKNINFPVNLYNVGGKRIGEIIGTVDTPLIVVNERFKKLVENNNLTGCAFFDVIVNDKAAKEDTYYGFSITGKCSWPDWSKSDIIRKSYFPTTPILNIRKGFYLKDEKSLATDFAYPIPGGFKVISKKAKEVLQKAKFKHLEFIHNKDFEITLSEDNPELTKPHTT